MMSSEVGFVAPVVIDCSTDLCALLSYHESFRNMCQLAGVGLVRTRLAVYSASPEGLGDRLSA